MIESTNNSHDEKVLQKLKEVEIFKEFSHDSEIIKKIAALCTERTYKAGEKIIEEGEFGDELFIFISGTIDILKNTLQNEKYTMTKLNADNKSIHVGEMALIDNDRRSATVLAEANCKCLVINRENFIKFGNENPVVGLAITRVIASQISTMLRKATADVITLFSALVEEIAEV